MVRFIEKKNDPFENEENVLVGALVTGVALGKFVPNLYNKLFYQQNYAFFPELIHDDYWHQDRQTLT